MPGGARGEVTDLLLAWGQGEDAAFEKLVPIVHAELCRLARRYMRGERANHTLQTSALVNEAYLRLIESRRVHWRDHSHFLAVSAQLMRRILVDSARSRRSAKRGGEDWRVTLADGLDVAEAKTRDLVALDDALTALAARDARKAQLIELRFFGGLSVRETAGVLGVSEDTVIRDWRLARAWLLRELSTGARDAGS
jgi:RNA polymerase sigma factor (TIGR02999 family)